MKEMLMWDKYDDKYRKVVDVEVARGLEADLYEANNRINDLLDIVKQKDKLIDEIILYIIRHNYFDTTEFDEKMIPTIENTRKYFEERCK